MLDQVLFFAPLALYVGVIAAVALTTRTGSDDTDYFFASRRLHWIQSVLSVISSETSVATTVVFPAAGLAGVIFDGHSLASLDSIPRFEPLIAWTGLLLAAGRTNSGQPS